ncbi:MAG: penicillin-binding protein activator [Armatimonadetes bacterium]|nr:penicillin-binding protein activator [Armatimonadota bacterium]
MSATVKRRAPWAVIIVAAFIVVAAIAYFATRRTADPNERDVLKVGVILPLTGSLAEGGRQALRGLELAVDRYNETADTYRIKLIVEDSRSEPRDGVTAFQKLVAVDGVKVVVGGLMSSVTLAIAPIAEREQVIVLSPGSSNPKVRDAGDYIFRNWASDDYDGRVMAAYAFESLNKRRAAVLYINNDYGLGLAEAFRITFEELGGEVSLMEPYAQGQSDFRPLLAKVSDYVVDCIFFPGQPSENGTIVRQCRELDIVATLLANLSVESPDFVTAAAGTQAGVIYSTPAFDPSSDEPTVKEFVRAFSDQYGDPPGIVAGHAFDAGNILIEALRRADFDLARLKQELYGIANFDGVTGVTTFDERGDVHKDVMIKVIQPDLSTSVLQRYSPHS